MSLIVFTTVSPWIERVVREVAPPEFEIEFLDVADEARAAALLPKTDFLVTFFLPRHQTRLLKRCRLVMLNGVGYDGVEVETLREMGVPVSITPPMTAEGVSEHVFMLILSLNKQLPAVRASMRAGEWDMFRWREGSHNLASKTLGIIGLGRIGKRVAHLAHAFGCRVVYNDIVDMPAELEARYELQRLPFDELVRAADIVTVHVPLTPLTRGLFGGDEFASMRSGSLFINTSRGSTYCLDSLYEAVVTGHLRGAGIDVFDPEPPPADHPIFQLPNVIATPHIASGTIQRQYAINRAQFANCQRILRGEEAVDVVN